MPTGQTHNESRNLENNRKKLRALDAFSKLIDEAVRSGESRQIIAEINCKGGSLGTPSVTIKAFLGDVHT